jgi:hypothetical protein
MSADVSTDTNAADMHTKADSRARRRRRHQRGCENACKQCFHGKSLWKIYVR